MSKSANTSQFCKDDTLVAKGIAILALIFHHLYPNNPGIPIDFANLSFGMLLATSGKVCVSLFAILSGYGLTEGWKRKNVDELCFALRHIWSLLTSFWACYLVVAILLCFSGTTPLSVYGEGGIGLAGNMLLDVLGLAELLRTPTLSGPWWYMSAALMFYLLYPLLHRGVKRFGIAFLAVCFLPWVAYLAIGDVEMHTDWFLFYIFSFSLGIYLSEKDLLGRLKNMSQKNPVASGLCSAVCFVGMIVVRGVVTLPADSFLALSIVAFSICVISRIHLFKVVLHKFGECSGIQYMIGSIVPLFVSSAVFPNIISRFVVFALVSLCLSMGVAQLQRAIGYEKIMKPWAFKGKGVTG